jgi:dihydroceramidase
MQLVDELSMIYTTCLMCFATFSYNKSQQYRTVLAICLVSLSVFITLYYHYLQDPSFHQNAYAILTAIVLIRSMYVMEVNIRPRLRCKEREASNPRPHGGDEAAKHRADEEDVETLRLMWKMVAIGLSVFLGGFALWNVDNAFCSTLTRWRREVGMPWSFVLEGHGWWWVLCVSSCETVDWWYRRHLMTGTGAYFAIVWGIWLRHYLNYRQDEYELFWPNIWTMPDVVKRRSADDGRMNGHMDEKAKN